ncbi:CBS domain-containing protein [Tuwongella immobilis]|uniref:CBS domain-containing protein n=1 Tax=Tuwongella immobilis TaxID=692036 RepID=A0A6C2YLM4_9BACT|nr:CBS domain-containing protein [Tuwongella immobilis]VIP02326.1 CBS domain containing protein OS=uncultured Acidobacteria bacterium GN=HGMM_F54F02C36 PE=4 SV=1: CBS: CBS [Tuwongella immobilis]VTS01064.1 CBS domain containing protein OS=uncultured Acidobacteria bacterium GN=HGMM_F54F02C36 PE=4 SV=1: CBS: CBS [Tuwongella immobilis]
MICPSCGHVNLPGADTCDNCLSDLSPLDLPIPQDRVEASLMMHTIFALEPRAPVTLPLSATLAEVIALMIQREVGAVLLIDEADQVCGIITERDFLTKLIGVVPNYDRLPARQFMTHDPETVAPRDTLATALGKMDLGGYRHLPVVNDGKAVGLISVRDIIDHMTRMTLKG